MIEEIYGDIANLNRHVDVIVNASNGIGYMGGFVSRNSKVSGVAESINYHTKGLAEKTAKKVIWEHRKLLGYKAGKVFEMGNCGLDCKVIYNAVTMFFPGTPAKYSVVGDLLNEVFKIFAESEYESIAIPLLGAGTGFLKPDTVKSLILLAHASYKGDLKDKKVFIVLPVGK